MDPYLLAIVHAMPDAVVCVDGQGVVVGWNESAASLFFVDERAAVGQPLRDLVGAPGEIVDGQRLRVSRKGGGGSIDVISAVTKDVHGGHTLVVFSPRAKRDPRDDLSPRLQQTLDALLAGRSEKQIATELGISKHTVHDYVKIIYREYDVASRAELLARALKRAR